MIHVSEKNFSSIDLILQFNLKGLHPWTLPLDPLGDFRPSNPLGLARKIQILATPMSTVVDADTTTDDKKTEKLLAVANAERG